jgi:hypothetical protein
MQPGVGILHLSTMDRLKHISCGVVILAALSGHGLKADEPSAPPRPPHRALADFDRDGIPDTAVIETDDRSSYVLIPLSGSRVITRIDGPVTGIVEDDIDHDGDADLLGATASGDLVVWLNDGRGRFTREQATHTRHVSRNPTLASAFHDAASVVLTKSPSITRPLRTFAITVSARDELPATRRRADTSDVFNPYLRAPPSAAS